MTCFRFLAGCLAGALCAPVLAADGIRVVNEGEIRDEWTLPQGYKLAMPVYPSAYVEQRAEVCVALGYLVNPDGSTSDFALLKSWTSADVPNKSSQDYWAAFANAAAQALSQWRFQPRPEVKAPRPVYTVATMLFAASPDLRSHCTIPNLTIRLRELRQDQSARRKMNTALFDRLELDPSRAQDTMRQPRM